MGLKKQSLGTTSDPTSYRFNSKRRKVLDDEEEEANLTQCGACGWRPKCLQMFASPFYFMLVMSLVGIFQAMTGSVFFGTSSTLEKRFGYDSKLTGLIMVMDNFAEILLNPFVAYLAVRFNRARLIASGELMLALSCFVTAAPYFIYGPGTHLLAKKVGSQAATNLQFCSETDVHSAECNSSALESSATVWPAVICLVFGSFMRGLGYTCYIVVGLPYLDDNAQKKSTPMYISTLSSLRLIGPAAGFMLASFSLSFYENPFMDPGIAHNDPRFIGAWWISFVIVGSCLLVVTLPLFLFPPQLKGAPVKMKETKQKIKEGGGSTGAFKRIITNPLVMCCLFANSFRIFGLWGYIYFKSKYLETQFRVSSSKASFITGAVGFVPQAIGIFAGGAVLSTLKPRPRIVFLLVFLCESAMIVSFAGGFFFGCDPVKIDGHPNPLTGKFELLAPAGITAGSCNSDCHCAANIFAPVCNLASKVTYFSPCHAGCKGFEGFNKTFNDCSCLEKGESIKVGYCPEDVEGCQTMLPYVLLLAVGGVIASTARTPNALISLRNVEPHDKAFAIGFAAAAIDLFAFIPASIVFGLIIDNTCLIWEEKCGRQGNCWVYDQAKFRNYLHGASIFCFITASCFDFAAIFMAHRVKNFYEDDEEPMIEGEGQGITNRGSPINEYEDEEIADRVIEIKTIRDF